MKFKVRVGRGRRLSSLPVRGAWVEISVSVTLAAYSRVAPRAGSVG